jgi:hypothetical protein
MPVAIKILLLRSTISVFQMSNSLGRGQSADFLSGGRRTHSLRIDSDMLVVTASPARTALKISQLTRRPPGGMPPTYDSMH